MLMLVKFEPEKTRKYVMYGPTGVRGYMISGNPDRNGRKPSWGLQYHCPIFIEMGFSTHQSRYDYGLGRMGRGTDQERV
jgi:hypothetical protein